MAYTDRLQYILTVSRQQNHNGHASGFSLGTFVPGGRLTASDSVWVPRGKLGVVESLLTNELRAVCAQLKPGLKCMHRYAILALQYCAWLDGHHSLGASQDDINLVATHLPFHFEPTV